MSSVGRTNRVADAALATDLALFNTIQKQKMNMMISKKQLLKFCFQICDLNYEL